MSKAPEDGFRDIVDALAIGIVLHRDRRILYANRFCLDALGLESLDELIGRDPIELLAPDDRDRHVQRIAAVARGETVQPAHARLTGHNGRSYTIEVVGYQVIFEGQPAIVTLVHDVTEQRSLEEQFRQAQKMESIGRLASGVAHDFNNLLTVILTCAETLQEGVLSGSPPVPEDVDEIRWAGERARELTRQLLALTRKQVIAPVPLDLNALLRGIEKLLRRLLREDVELVTSLEPAVWSVLSDPTLMEQVVLNLAVNAQDAMPNGGRLIIETANVEVHEPVTTTHSTMRAGLHVRLTMRDTGHGMSPEVKAHLFEPFFTTKGRGQGTGLGLATVYGIVKQSGGYVLVESNPGQGSKFEIYLPRTVEMPLSPSAPGRATWARGKETILVVEDDPNVREVAVRTLQAGGYRVRGACDAQEALAVTKKQLGQVDLLITDVIMPGGNGSVVARMLRRTHPNLRVLYVSGFAQDSIEQQGVLAPGVEFLQKPFNASSLLARVRTVLGASCESRVQGPLRRAPCTVLVVDDDPDIREAMASALESEGFVSLQASNGSEGLAIAREHHPDIILLDLMMPVLNGWEFRERQQADATLAKIRTVIVSAAAQEQATRLRDVLFLHKPFSLDELLAVVGECCERTMVDGHSL